MNPYIIPGLKFRKQTKFRQNGNITPEMCMQVVASYYEYPMDVFYKSYSRGSVNDSYVRNVLMYVMYNKTRLSLKEIGRYLGGFDHSSIINAKQRIREMMNKDDNTYTQVITILNKL